MKFLPEVSAKSLFIPEGEESNLEEFPSVFSFPLDWIVTLKETLPTVLLTPAPKDQQAMIERAERILGLIEIWYQEILAKQNEGELSDTEQSDLDVRRVAVSRVREYLGILTAGMGLIRRIR